MTIDEIVYVYICYICARLEHPDGPVVDLFESDPWEGDVDGGIVGREIEGWWESLTFDGVTPDPAAPVDIAAVDELLRTCGYQRLNGWTTRRGRSGQTVHSADGQIRIEDIR